MNRRFVTVLGAAVVGVSSSSVGLLPGYADAATTALLVGGKNKYADLTEEQMAEAFGGYFAGYDARVNVEFPGKGFRRSVEVGATNLYADLQSTFAADPDGFVTIGGVSQGAPSVTAVLQRLADELENAPDGVIVPGPDQLNAAVYGFPSKSLRVGTGYEPFPETPYDLLYVFAQYDFIGDFPDNPFNMLAVSNAVMGGVLLHVQMSSFPILGEPTLWTSSVNGEGGRTTVVMIPTAVLPILVPLQKAGVSDEVIAELDARLRPKIDRAYNRPDMTYGVIPDTVVPPPPGYTAPESEEEDPVAPEPATTVASSRVASTTEENPETDRTEVEEAVDPDDPPGEPVVEEQQNDNPAANDTESDGQTVDVEDEGSGADEVAASGSAGDGPRASSTRRGAGKDSAPRRFGRHRT